tara:strand:- start:2009 stop:2455 length:447 start_codon:yes stop_codon:yes gene_type:complete
MGYKGSKEDRIFYDETHNDELKLEYQCKILDNINKQKNRMKVEGTIKVINATVKVSEKFSKREVVVTTNDMYPQEILVQFTQDGCAKLDGYKVGHQVAIDINLRGREWLSPQGQTKYFNTIEGWKIERAVGDAPAPVPVSKEDDDLPF